jgi:PQQ enzyme repeat
MGISHEVSDRVTFRLRGRSSLLANLHGADPAGESMPDPFDIYLSSPTIDADTVYVGSGDGNIYALDAASGTLRWKFHTGASRPVRTTKSPTRSVSSPRRWSPTAWCISVAATQTCMRSTPSAAQRSGRFPVRALGSLRRPLRRRGRFISPPRILPYSMRSMPRAAHSSIN